jgi:cation transport ATPase
MNNSQPKSKDYQKDIQITGMTCINCARRVEQSLQKINGVKFASVNLATESAYNIFKIIRQNLFWAFLYNTL